MDSCPQGKNPGKIGRGRVQDSPVVILKRDVFTGEYAPGINPASITLLHQSSAMQTEECQRGVSGSSYERVAGLKGVCHSFQRDGAKVVYHSYPAEYRSSYPRGVFGFVCRSY